MQTLKFLFNAINYAFYVFYSFTFIDIVKKITFGEFYMSNITNVIQLLMAIVGLFFAYYKLMSYKRDSETKSKMLNQELREKEISLWYMENGKEIAQQKAMFEKFKTEFIEPFNNEENETIR